ncbi:major intrinsically disordered Notch2-binding receptor 1 [Hypanus sabinus]|uniref:major intrinsically disordered Notch2-binding receptor 1 n=1 Tax=Hypanus sabinus TaxID=79690 RepID=UPI0028C4E002|nr:major intrinsically disordered Notch2-binding receptor 1 [Hypanus sabinus]
MEGAPEYSLFLVRILEELDANRGTVSYQDLCKLLCARFDLTHLAKLRSLLFYTACLDPNFPATLFKEKLRCSVDNTQSKKIMIAADIVTMFNLIQMNGGVAKERLPHRHQQKVRKNESFESCRSDTEISRIRSPVYTCNHDPASREHAASRRPSSSPASDCKDCQRFICTSDPNFFLGVRNEGTLENNGRTTSLDRLQASPTFNGIDPSDCVMQSTYFPMDPGQESNSDQDSPSRKADRNGTFDSSDEAFTISPCAEATSVFNNELQDMLPCVGKLVSMDKESEDEDQDPHIPNTFSRFSTFFSNSFEVPYSNPYCDTIPTSNHEKRYVKHESLDDLQGSTYFGPSTISQEPQNLTKPIKPSSWLLKSWSLNAEQAEDGQKYFGSEKRPGMGHQYQASTKEELIAEARQRQAAAAAEAISTMDRAQSYFQQADDSVHFPPAAAEPAGSSNPRKLKEKGCKTPSLEQTTSVGTQTEQVSRARGQAIGRCARPKPGEKAGVRQSDEDSEALSDDISDIFRFLDDMSVSGSTGLLQSCYNSNGSLSRLPKADGGSPEKTPAKGGGPQSDTTQGHRPCQSADEELKTSVCKLVLRVGEIEKKLETLSGVRDEISQVLAKLNHLDQKIQEPAAEKASPDSNTDSLRVKALRKSLFVRRSSKSLTEENSATESKIASISNSPRDCRAMGCGGEMGQSKRQGTADSKDWQRKHREADRRCVTSQSHRPPKPGKDSLLIEQVFSPHVYPNSMKSHMKNNPLYTDLRLTEVLEQKQPQPSWAIEEYNRNASEKNQESLNPNNLEYWMEDIYTPGYDSLLKRKEAEFRRARICKIAALIAAAVCTVVLVIVVPICTMKS